MNEIEITSTVESNVDNLSARSVHRLFEDLAERMLRRGEELLRVNAPKDTGMMAEHVSHHGPVSVVDVIEGSVGIPPINVVNRRWQVGTKDFAVPGDQSSANYPIFVDRGTGLFGPVHTMIHSRRAHVMHWENSEGSFFRAQTRGQRPQHFMLDTYEQMSRTLLPIESQIFGRRVRSLAVDPSPSIGL